MGHCWILFNALFGDEDGDNIEDDEDEEIEDEKYSDEENGVSALHRFKLIGGNDVCLPCD